MFNVTDSAVDAAENEISSKKRGRKKGSMRSIYFIGVSSSGEVKEIEQIPTINEPLSRATAETAINAELGSGCKILGPFHKVKGIKSDTEREMVTVSIRNLNYTKNKFEGEYQGWKFFGNGISSCTINGEEFEDDDLIHGEFESRINEESGISKPRVMRNAMIRRSLVDSIESA